MRTLRVMMFLLLALPSLAMAASTAEGQQIYQSNCAMCHGMQGVSVMPNAASFKRGEGLFKPDTALFGHIKTGKNACPPFIGRLKDQQIFDLISYLRTLYP